jgi:hypothetical protein
MSNIVFLVPIFAVLGFFAWLLAISPVGRALADRLREPGAGPEVADLKASLDQVRHDVAELAERMDFTERLLAERRDARLEPGDRR